MSTKYRLAVTVLIDIRLSEIENVTVGLIEGGEYKPDDPKILV